MAADYTYPATDIELAGYAAELERFHAAQSLSTEARDESTRDVLRSVVIDQLSKASTSYRANNVRRTKARTRVLLAALLGFGLRLPRKPLF